MVERRPSNSELRLRRLVNEDPETEPRGILEIFDAEAPDEDAALARDEDDEQ